MATNEAFLDFLKGKSAEELGRVKWSQYPARERLSTLPDWDIDDGGPGWIGGYRTLGWEFLSWVTDFMVQPNGRRAGEQFQWIGSQMKFFLCWYAIDEDGEWIFHRGARRLSKGIGKSPSMALWALGEFCAPVRIKDLDDTALGGVVGQAMAMPLVQIAATAESQTHNTMRMVRAFAPKGSRVVTEHGLDPGKVQYYRQPEGTLEIITSSASAAEGAEGSAVVADEVHLWTPSNGGVELHGTLVDNLTKTGSRMLESNNAWFHDKDCVAQKTYEAWVDQEEGRRRGQAKILYDARIAPPDTDWTSETSLMRMLDFVYDDCWWAPKKFYIERIWDPSSSFPDSKRKYGNLPSDASGAWITREQLSLIMDTSRKVETGEEIVAFFDGSRTGDATALVGCCVEDGHVFLIDMWEPTTANPHIPVAEVDAAVRKMKDDYVVRAFFGDVKEWESYTKVAWPEFFLDDTAGKPDIELWAVKSGKDPQLIAWDMRNHIWDFTKAAELTRAEIRDKKFTYDGHPRLQRHMLNLREHPNRYGINVRKESAASPNKIDGGVCFIGARMVRGLIAAGELKNKKKKKTGRTSFIS